MPLDTFHYVNPDCVLDAAFGGAVIQIATGSITLPPEDVTLRRIMLGLGIPAAGTDTIGKIGVSTHLFSGTGVATVFALPYAVTGSQAIAVTVGGAAIPVTGYTASGTNLTFGSAPVTGTNNISVAITWLRFEDVAYPAVAPLLSAAESATILAAAPSGFLLGGALPRFLPSSEKTNVHGYGDSILFGLATTTGKPDNSWLYQAVDSIQTLSVLADASVDKREATSLRYRVNNAAIPSGSWANTVDQGGGVGVSFAYRHDLCFAQFVRTLPCANSRNIFVYAYGSNDVDYDPSVTGAIAWARAVARITALKAQFPNAKVVICTLIKRFMTAADNPRLNDYNILARANYLNFGAGVGADILCDFEANIPQMNIVTGDTTNATYYNPAADQTHPKTAGHALMAVVARSAILAAEALFPA